MNEPGDPRRTEPSNPAGDLGEVWDALDVLPRSEASPSMAATTVDLVAVTTERSVAGRTTRGLVPVAGASRSWIVPVVVVACGLVAGVVAGRMTAPDPDARILEDLPVIRHFAMLREAGSVDFLQSLAARRNRQPMRLPPEMLRQEEEEFDAALRNLETDHAVGAAGRALIEQRRNVVETLPFGERDAIEQSASIYKGLPSSVRRELASTAAVLADPSREEIRASARLWHLLIAASDPPDRRNIVDLSPDERLEWLERRSRYREWLGDRRNQPAGGEPGAAPRGPGAGDGRPRWQGPRADGEPRGDRTGPRPGDAVPDQPHADAASPTRPEGDNGPRDPAPSNEP